jgi:hypothetical protein
MSGRPNKHGKQVLLVFNQLAKMGAIKGNLILSTPYGPVTLKFPLKDELITQIETPYGSEGINRSLRRTEPLIKKADVNICLTDGQITDSAIDVAYWRRHKVEILGIYVGDPTGAKRNLQRYFAHGIARRTVEEVISELVNKIKLVNKKNHKRG